MENKKIIPLLIVAFILYRFYKKNKELQIDIVCLKSDNEQMQIEIMLDIAAKVETENLLSSLKYKNIKNDITAYEVFENLKKVANGKPAFDPEKI